MNHKSWLTSVSASRKTHFLYWVSVQQWILVKVMPSSGRPNRDRCTLSLLSIRLTTTTSSNILLRVILVGHDKRGPHPFFQVFKRKKTCHPPRLFGHVRRDQDNQASRRPMMPQTPGHHYGAHAVRVCGDQGDKGFPGLTSGGWITWIYSDLVNKSKFWCTFFKFCQINVSAICYLPLFETTGAGWEFCKTNSSQDPVVSFVLL